MNMLHLETLLILCLASITCSLPGVFLVLRGISFITDAISHAVLLGIVLAFLIVKKLSSPFLLCGASLAGLAAVFVTETVMHYTKLKKDAIIGLVFPIFFSLAVILINLYAHNVHLDADMVMLGDAAFAPFSRLFIAGIDCGPKTFWILFASLCANSLFIYLFFKELVLTTFDYTCAHIAGFSPLLLHYALVALTSFTAVCTFDSVGSIVVIALIVIPAGTAFFFTHRVKDTLKLSLAIALAATMLGYTCAAYFDTSIAGSIAVAQGCLFFLGALFSPKKGLIRTYLYNKKQQQLLHAHLLHDYLQKRSSPTTIQTALQDLNWKQRRMLVIIATAKYNNLISESNGTIKAISTKYKRTTNDEDYALYNKSNYSHAKQQKL